MKRFTLAGCAYSLAFGAAAKITKCL